MCFARLFVCLFVWGVCFCLVCWFVFVGVVVNLFFLWKQAALNRLRISCTSCNTGPNKLHFAVVSALQSVWFVLPSPLPLPGRYVWDVHSPRSIPFPFYLRFTSIIFFAAVLGASQNYAFLNSLCGRTKNRRTIRVHTTVFRSIYLFTQNTNTETLQRNKPVSPS